MEMENSWTLLSAFGSWVGGRHKHTHFGVNSHNNLCCITFIHSCNIWCIVQESANYKFPFLPASKSLLSLQHSGKQAERRVRQSHHKFINLHCNLHWQLSFFRLHIFYAVQTAACPVWSVMKCLSAWSLDFVSLKFNFATLLQLCNCPIIITCVIRATRLHLLITMLACEVPRVVAAAADQSSISRQTVTEVSHERSMMKCFSVIVINS